MVHFFRQLQRINKSLLALGAMVEEALHDAIVAVERRDPDLARRVVEGDRAIDRHETEIEEDCLQVLALYQPVAIDLRYLVGVLKINHDLERIGDLAVNIAERAHLLAHETPVTVPYDLTGMSQKVEAMLRGGLAAFVEMDAAAAQAIRADDDEVDEINRGMYERVGAAAREHPDQVEQMIQLLIISRSLERIADHVVNICKDVMFMAEGEVVRHLKGQPEQA